MALRGHMSALKIHDLSICETIVGSCVQGGLLEEEQRELDLLDWLTNSIPEFDKLSSEQKGEYLLEIFGDQKGENYGYRASRQDGKHILAGGSGSIGDRIYAFSYSKKTS
ncbi:hypothetical protein H6G64_14630 [Calothrix sp. FACHB-156]|nr:hypothetical protein [Calothrix sp. FACHB-156]